MRTYFNMQEKKCLLTK